MITSQERPGNIIFCTMVDVLVKVFVERLVVRSRDLHTHTFQESVKWCICTKLKHLLYCATGEFDKHEKNCQFIKPTSGFQVKKITTLVRKTTAAVFIKFAQSFCFIVLLVDFDENCKYLQFFHLPVVLRLKKIVTCMGIDKGGFWGLKPLVFL